MKKRHLSHGEVNLFEIEEIPSTAKKITPTRDSLHTEDQFKIAASKTTVNHHLVQLNDQVELYEDTHGTLYIRNLQPTKISCVDTQRHDTEILPIGIWKIKPAKEVDHLLQIKREVVD